MIEIAAKPREALGKKAKQVRATGEIPAVLYGYKVEATPLRVDARAFEKVLAEAGESTLLSLHVENGGAHNVLIHDIAHDSLKGNPTHVDFYAVRMDRPIEAAVRLAFEGESEAVKALGGVLIKVLQEVHMRALPKDLPHEIVVDISPLQALEDQVLIKDLSVPAGVEILAEEDQVVALVEPPRTEEEMAALDEVTAPSLEDIEVAGKKEKEEEENAEAEPKVKEVKEQKE